MKHNVSRGYLGLPRVALTARAVLWVSALLATATCGHGQTNPIVIGFADGTNGAPIYQFYECSYGITFYNVVWVANIIDVGGQVFAGIATNEYVIAGQTSGAAPTSAQPLMAVFDVPVTNVSIIATDVGDAGARIEAYDQVLGGNLVATNEFYGSGIGLQTFTNLQVSAPMIRRIVMFQPQPNYYDGMVWGHLTFAPAVSPDCPAPIVSNGDFETPQLPPDTFGYGFPTNSSWTGTGGLISPPADGFGAPWGPLGLQMAFLQGGSFMLQTISLPTNGIYRIRYADSGRPRSPYGPGGDTTYQILLDSNVIAQASTHTGQPFTPEGFAFDAQAGQHTLEFQVVSFNGDNTAFFDAVSVEYVSPEELLPPSITFFQPTNTVVAWGSYATFNVGAVGAQPMALQWFLNGAQVPGETNWSLTLSNLSYGSSSCFVIISNAFGAATSAVGVVSVPIPWAGIVWNGDFETPPLAGPYPVASPFPANAVWMGQASGILWPPAYEAPFAPSGNQVAFLQGLGAYMAQPINLASDGIYQITFWDAGRPDEYGAWGGNTTYQILLDATFVAQLSTSSGQPFTPETFPFNSTRGQHLLEFEVTASNGDNGDNTAFFDAIGIRFLPPLLTIERSGSQIVISWPAVYTGFSLQQSSDPSTGNWSTSSYPITIINGTNVVAFIPSSNLFFRLQQY